MCPQEGRVWDIHLFRDQDHTVREPDFPDQPFLLNVMFFRSTGGVECVNSLLLLVPNIDGCPTLQSPPLSAPF